MNKGIRYTIEYTVQPENANMEEVIDKLAEFGSVEIVDVQIVDGRQ